MERCPSPPDPKPPEARRPSSKNCGVRPVLVLATAVDNTRATVATVAEGFRCLRAGARGSSKSRQLLDAEAPALQVQVREPRGVVNLGPETRFNARKARLCRFPGASGTPGRQPSTSREFKRAGKAEHRSRRGKVQPKRLPRNLASPASKGLALGRGFENLGLTGHEARAERPLNSLYRSPSSP